jgi:hypothetical protein
MDMQDIDNDSGLGYPVCYVGLFRSYRFYVVGISRDIG